MTRLPRLLDSDLKEVSRLHPISLSITEKLVPLSFASMYLLKDEMVKERQWVELFTPVGSAGIYRTRAPQTGVGAENYAVELDHGIAELGDYIIPDTIDKQMTCKAAITEIFKHYRGKRWKLGVVQCTSNVVVDIDYDNLLEAINDILDQTIDYVMSFNFTTSPWTLDIVHKETTVTAEGRLSRNVKTATIKSDDKDLCTRVYVKGLTAKDTYGFVDANTQSKYGLIEHVETGTGYTKEQAQLVADHYLAAHKNPKVSVEISAIELSQNTGEELDKFRPGKLFRLAIPSHGITVEDVITSVTWSDVYGNPMEATVSLGDDRDSVLSFWQKQKSSGKATQKTGTKTYKTTQENKTHIEQTETYVDLYAAKTDLNGKILEQAGLYLDAKGIIAYAEDKVNGIGSRFKVFSDRIDATVKDINGLSASLAIEKGRIDAAVTDIDGLSGELELTKTSFTTTIRNTKEELESQIEQTDSKIALKVSKGDVATQLVVEMNNVTISNGNLVVEGMVTADAVKTAFAAIQTVTANTINAGALNVAVGQNWVPVATQTYVSGAVWNLSLTDNGGGSYTLKWKELGEAGSPEHTANFSKAASLSGAWSGTTYTATTGTRSVSTTVLLDYTSGTTNFAVHLCHDSSAQVNRLLSRSFFLVQDVDAKEVTCRLGSSTGNIYGTISTNATYNSVTVDSVSRSGNVVTATASNGKTGTLSMSTYSNAVSNVTSINAVSSSSPTTMYAYVNGTLTGMGTGYWYKRDGYMATTTMYR